MWWRTLLPSDLPAVGAIAALVHPAFPEDDAVFAERQRLYPAGMHLLEHHGTALGYLVSHPWRSGSIPALNRLLHRLPADPDLLYLHDLALLPSARGTGSAATIVTAMAAHAAAAGFSTMGLVAVNGSTGFWQRHGFHAEDAPALAETLAHYEPAARLMTRRLG